MLLPIVSRSIITTNWLETPKTPSKERSPTIACLVASTEYRPSNPTNLTPERNISFKKNLEIGIDSDRSYHCCLVNPRPFQRDQRIARRNGLRHPALGRVRRMGADFSDRVEDCRAIDKRLAERSKSEDKLGRLPERPRREKPRHSRHRHRGRQHARRQTWV